MGSTATPLDFTEFLEKYSVFVAKADFKFNAAHFVAYKGFRERLHGHNYTVGVRLEAEGIQADGYVVDFGDIKTVARRLCKALNELFLCPGQVPLIALQSDGMRTSQRVAARATSSTSRSTSRRRPCRSPARTVLRSGHLLPSAREPPPGEVTTDSPWWCGPRGRDSSVSRSMTP